MVPSVGQEAIANRILLALPTGVLRQILPHLRPRELKRGQTVCRLGEPVRVVLFVNRGIVSLIKTMRDGDAVEIGAKGIEGITAQETLFGIDTPLFESVVQIRGSAFAIDRVTLRGLIEKNSALRALFQGYVHVAADQIAQTAACNRLHFLEQRCCRWLLIAHDSARSDTFPLTHEFLAMMLGVHRPGLSVAAASLQNAGLIRYRGGHLTIIDRKGLEASACECYGVIRDQFERLFTRRKLSA